MPAAVDVLLIEDEPSIAEAILFMLRRDGWHCRSWAQGVGAIQVMSVGDNDGLPSMAELAAFMARDPHWRKAHED